MTDAADADLVFGVDGSVLYMSERAIDVYHANSLVTAAVVAAIEGVSAVTLDVAAAVREAERIVTERQEDE